MPTNTYDVIVLGDEFPGVVAATLCASRGMRVLLAYTRSYPESYQIGPYRLPTRPLSFVGFGSPAVRRVMEELNFTHLLKRRMRDNEPPFQFIAPNARIDVGADDAALAAELAREFPEADAAAVKDLLLASADVSELLEPVLGQAIAFPPVGFWERREIARTEEPLAALGAQIERALADAPLARALLEGPAVLGAHGDPASLTAVARGRQLDLWRRHTALLPGGRDALRGIFLDKFASHGGEVRKLVPAELSIGWGKVTGVTLDDGEELGAEQVICAMPIEGVARLSGKKPPKRLAQIADEMTPTAYRYVLNLVMNEAGIPEGMGTSALIVTDPHAPLVEDNAIAIYVGEVDEEARRTVTVEALCPAGDSGDLQPQLEALRVKLRARLEDVMPFSADHVLCAHSPHETGGVEGIDAVSDLPHPARPLPVWRCDTPALLGVTGVPYHVGLKRLILASAQVLPGLGLEGEFAVGWCAARLAAGGSKKKDLLKDEVIAGSR